MNLEDLKSSRKIFDDIMSKKIIEKNAPYTHDSRINRIQNEEISALYTMVSAICEFLEGAEEHARELRRV